MLVIHGNSNLQNIVTPFKSKEVKNKTKHLIVVGICIRQIQLQINNNGVQNCKLLKQLLIFTGVNISEPTD